MERGGIEELDNDSDISSQGSLLLGQASPVKSSSGSDSSFVGESRAKAAEMAANSTVGGGGRRYHTKQVTREATRVRARADEGDNHEEEMGGGPSEGGGGLHLSWCHGAY